MTSKTASSSLWYTEATENGTKPYILKYLTQTMRKITLSNKIKVPIVWKHPIFLTFRGRLEANDLRGQIFSKLRVAYVITEAPAKDLSFYLNY